MPKQKGFFRDTPSKSEFGYSKIRNTLSKKDRKNLQDILGKFDIQTSLYDLHKKLARSRRFGNSKPPADGSIHLISNSGFSGHMDKATFVELCHS